MRHTGGTSGGGWLHHTGDVFSGALRPIARYALPYRPKMWWIPTLPIDVLWRSRSPARPWTQPIPEPPESLKTVPGIKLVTEAQQAAFDDNPLHDFIRLHPGMRGNESPTAHMWVSTLMPAPRMQAAARRAEFVRNLMPKVEPRRADPARLTTALRAEAARLGLSAIGVTEYDVKYDFAEYHGLNVGDTVIVGLLEQKYDSTQMIPSIRSEKAALSGSRCRLHVMTTDAPFVRDEPVDYGLEGVCDECRICVRRCPPGAIPANRKESRGVVKAKLNTKRCLPVMGKASDCSICMKVCPVQRYGLPAVLDEYERTGKILGKGTDDLEGYDWPLDGEHYGPGKTPRITRRSWRRPASNSTWTAGSRRPSRRTSRPRSGWGPWGTDPSPFRGQRLAMRPPNAVRSPAPERTRCHHHRGPLVRGVSTTRWSSSPAPPAGSAGRARDAWPTRAPRSSSRAGRPEPCAEVAAEVRSRGGRALAVPADVTDRSAVERLVDRAVETFGRLDAAVNNAGVSPKSVPAAECPDDVWDSTFDLNARAVVHACRTPVHAPGDAGRDRQRRVLRRGCRPGPGHRGAAFRWAACPSRRKWRPSSPSCSPTTHRSSPGSSWSPTAASPSDPGRPPV